MTDEGFWLDMEHVVIVGAGQGGAQVAVSLRDEGFAGAITLIGDEPGLPYHRPPLSKAYLTGATGRDGIILRAASVYAERAIALRPESRVAAIDRAARRVRLASGEALPYDHLVLATGGRPRPLPVPGADLPNVLALRDVADAEAIRAALGAARRVAVVGAGFVGLEVAAVAAVAAREVAVLEAGARPMARAVSLPVSDFATGAFARLGASVAFGAVVSRIVGRGGRAVAVETADGRAVPADLVVVGIGILPNVELAAESGLAIANGIVVDETLATADPAVSAIGDVAVFPCAFAGGAMTRLESVQNAVDGARCVAARIAGRPAPYRTVPWFWSDQGADKLQLAGLASPAADIVVRGDVAGGRFSVFSLEGDRLARVESVNRPADHMAARRLLATGRVVSSAELAAAGYDLRALLS